MVTRALLGGVFWVVSSVLLTWLLGCSGWFQGSCCVVMMFLMVSRALLCSYCVLVGFYGVTMWLLGCYGMFLGGCYDVLNGF